MINNDSLLIGQKRKTAIVDTNLLLVYLIGCIDPIQIEKFKKTNSRYRMADFPILDDIFKNFNNYTTTPNILTEVSNLGGQLNGKTRDRFFEILSQFIQRTKETYIKSYEISNDIYFAKLGLTDRGLLSFDIEKHIIITDDYKLCAFCDKFKLSSINFNHYRDFS